MQLAFVNIFTHYFNNKNAGILYLSSITSAVASPVVLNLIGVRSTIGVGALLYSGLFVGVIFLKAWTIYLGSCITGKV